MISNVNNANNLSWYWSRDTKIQQANIPIPIRYLNHVSIDHDEIRYDKEDRDENNSCSILGEIISMSHYVPMNIYMTVTGLQEIPQIVLIWHDIVTFIFEQYYANSKYCVCGIDKLWINMSGFMTLYRIERHVTIKPIEHIATV